MNETCYQCGAELIEPEIEYNNEHAEYCCSGHECGCMGMPIEPPYCFQCISKGLKGWSEIIHKDNEYIKIGKAIKWAVANGYEITKPEHFQYIEYTIEDIITSHREEEGGTT